MLWALVKGLAFGFLAVVVAAVVLVLLLGLIEAIIKA